MVEKQGFFFFLALIFGIIIFSVSSWAVQVDEVVH